MTTPGTAPSPALSPVTQGWTPDLTDERTLREALEHAFDYRGDVTLTLRDGSKIEGYIFDRRNDSPNLAECTLRLLPKDSNNKIAVPYTQIAQIAFTGRDTAAGKSFETWMRKYFERKRAGEKNISLEPEKLD